MLEVGSEGAEVTLVEPAAVVARVLPFAYPVRMFGVGLVSSDDIALVKAMVKYEVGGFAACARGGRSILRFTLQLARGLDSLYHSLKCCELQEHILTCVDFGVYRETLAKAESGSHSLELVPLTVQLACLSDHHDLEGALLSSCLPLFVGKPVHKIRSTISGVPGILPEFASQLVRLWTTRPLDYPNGWFIECSTRPSRYLATFTMRPSSCGSIARSL